MLAQSTTEDSLGACFKIVQCFNIRAWTASGLEAASLRPHIRWHQSKGVEKDCMGGMSQRVMMKEHVR